MERIEGLIRQCADSVRTAIASVAAALISEFGASQRQKLLNLCCRLLLHPGHHMAIGVQG